MQITLPSMVTRAVLFALGLQLVLDLVLVRIAGLEFTGLFPGVYALIVLAAVSIVYGIGGRSPVISSITGGLFCWAVFTPIAVVYSYVVATLNKELIDGYLSTMDSRLGFNWPAWYAWFLNQRYLKVVLYWVYNSLYFQAVVAIVIFVVMKQKDRVSEMLLHTIAACFICVTISGFYPALCACVYYDIPGATLGHLQDLQGLRSGARTSFDIQHSEGIVTFPSFHTAMAVIFAYAHRSIRWSFPLFLILNALMLFSIPFVGCHYLTDVIAGVGVAALSIFIISPLTKTNVVVDNKMRAKTDFIIG